MKVKGINPVEQHVEKIVLAVVAVVLLAVIAMQFLTSPNAVEVAANDERPPDQIYTVLQDRANRLRGQMEDPSPTLPEVNRADLLGLYEAGAGKAVAPAPTLAAWLDRGSGVEALAGGLEDVAAGSGLVSPIEVPALTEPVGFAQWATLDPFWLAQNPGVAPGVPEGQPHDVAGVSVQGTFNGKALYAALSQPEDGSRPVPRRLWQRGGLSLLGVEVERQRRTAEGTWGASETVQGFVPGVRPLDEVSGSPDPAVLTGTARAVSQAVGAVIQPAYPATISGEAWRPPGESAARFGRSGTQSRADRVLAQIARLEQEIQELTSGGGRTVVQRPTTGRDPGGRDPGGRGPAGPGTRGDPAPSTTTPRDTTERQVEIKQAQIDRLREELTDLGYTAPEVATLASGASSAPIGLQAVLESEATPVWAHDLGVEPGAAYRYRLRVVANNPLYGQQTAVDAADPSQVALTRDALLRSAWSDWSEPVEVPERTYFFVRSATEQDALGLGARVTAEVYRMYYGYYRRASVSMELGDVIRAEAAVPGTLALFDPARVDVAGAEGAIARIRSEAGGQDPVRSGGQPRGTGALEWPLGVSPAPSTVPVAMDVALVDVVQTLESGVDSGLGRASRPGVQALFRDVGGALLVRSVGEEGGELFDRVSWSADRGAVALLERRVPGQGPSFAAGASPQADPAYDPRQIYDDRGGSGRTPAGPGRDGP